MLTGTLGNSLADEVTWYFESSLAIPAAVVGMQEEGNILNFFLAGL